MRRTWLRCRNRVGVAPPRLHTTARVGALNSLLFHEASDTPASDGNPFVRWSVEQSGRAVEFERETMQIDEACRDLLIALPPLVRRAIPLRRESTGGNRLPATLRGHRRICLMCSDELEHPDQIERVSGRIQAAAPDRISLSTTSWRFLRRRRASCPRSTVLVALGLPHAVTDREV